MRNTIKNINAFNIKMLSRKKNNFLTTAAAGAKRFLDQKITQKQGLLRNSNLEISRNKQHESHNSV